MFSMGALRLLQSHVSTGVRPAAGVADARRFELASLAGRFVELSGKGASAVLSMAFRLVFEAQCQGKNVAWVSLCQTSVPVRRAAVSPSATVSNRRARPTPFHAPDVAAAGIDLRALPVVLAPGPLEAGRAASHLLRSGAFALVVLDLVLAVEVEVDLPLPLQSRLTGLAQTHGSVLLALTEKPPEAGSIGSLVSLHANVGRVRVRTQAPDGDVRFEVEVTAQKDKRHGPGWTHKEVFRAPAGLS